VTQRPVPPSAPSSYRGPYPIAQPAVGASTPCDEVLVARLAGGLQRLQWLGASLERLVRRLAGRRTA